MKLKSRNNQWMSVLTVCVGLLFIYLLKNKADPSSNETAAIWLGYLLFFLGLGSYLYNEEIEIEIQFDLKKIIHQAKNIFNTITTEITFDAIEKIVVRRLGKASSHSEFYFLVIKLNNQKTLQTGLYYTSEIEAYNKAEEIAKLIGCESSKVVLPNENLNSINFFLSFVFAVVLYAVYYRATIGQFCNAMWFGSLPVVMILGGTLVFYPILRKLNR